LFIVAMAFPVAVLGNVVRITTVILVGDAFGKEYGAMIEQKFGFITFAVAVGAILLTGFILKEDKPKSVEAPEMPLDAKPA
jgi:exosortase/archaeosortase family protein